MKKVILVIKAITGYVGSSESPEKMSMRMIGIVTALIAKFVPSILLILGAFVTLPDSITSEQLVASVGPIIQAGTFIVAATLYFIGMTRAVIQALKTKNLGALVGGK